MKNNKRLYSKNDLLTALHGKYSDNWREFIRQKEGKWLYRNDTKMFKEFHSEFQGLAFDFRENEFQKTIIKEMKVFFKKENIECKITEEVIIGEIDGVKNRIDIILDLPEFDLILPIELKHDLSYWKNSDISEQLARYNKLLNNETYLVSPNGRYGFSKDEFFFIIKTLVNKNELFLTNSLEYIREFKVA